MYTEFTNNHTNLLHIPGGIFHYLFLKLVKVHSYCIFYTLTTDHFLVGSEQESGSMIIVVMPATDLLFFKVPSKACKEI